MLLGVRIRSDCSRPMAAIAMSPVNNVNLRKLSAELVFWNIQFSSESISNRTKTPAQYYVAVDRQSLAAVDWHLQCVLGHQREALRRNREHVIQGRCETQIVDA
jgi:hypothetical protein